MRRKSSSLFAFAALLAFGTAHSEMALRVDYSAIFDNSVLPTGFESTPPFVVQGSFSFLSAPPYNSTATYADYALLSQQIYVNGTLAFANGPTGPTASSLEINDNDDTFEVPTDSALVFAAGNYTTSNGLTIDLVYALFYDPDGLYLSSTDLLLSSAAFANFPVKSLFIDVCRDNFAECDGVAAPITQVSVSSFEFSPTVPIPEPETYSLMLAGFGLLWRAVFKQRAKATGLIH